MNTPIQFAVFDGFDEIDVFGPLEVLAAAGYEVQLAALTPGTVTSMRGIPIKVTAVLQPAHGLIVPGGGWLDRAPRGARTEVASGLLGARLREIADSCRWVGSVCSGAMILAHAGLLDGRAATTNRACLADLAPFVAEAVDARVVDDGDRVTAGALFSGVDLGLWIVERELGSRSSRELGARWGYERQQSVWFADPRSRTTPRDRAPAQD
ncbi:DJ-1/PfpI family protein [Brachybacterium subflavum]|uniref:DJ-1/PfpI family protein n=1 Tax=Brachybacterium subflavum TaxID=2585206 RepID=UPI001879F1F1|nr:DJ-1/PfpI family protein [Brachybacterium subflavum]